MIHCVDSVAQVYYYFLDTEKFFDILENRSGNVHMVFRTNDFHAMNYNPSAVRLLFPLFPLREVKVMV